MKYPESLPELEPGGFYFWDLRVFPETSKPAVAGADFSILDSSETEDLAQRRADLDDLSRSSTGDLTREIVLSVMLVDLELFQDAEDLLLELDRKNPNEVWVDEALEELYRRWGRSPSKTHSEPSP